MAANGAAPEPRQHQRLGRDLDHLLIGVSLPSVIGVTCSARGGRRRARASLRLPRPRPTGNQIYFIGATNVPLENLDPALTRPGRMGRHVNFRTPTKEDRKDIFDLYLGKVAHDPSSTPPSAATRSRASRTATRRR